MRKFAKWVGGILAGLALTVLLILQLGFSDPLSAAMGGGRVGDWAGVLCQSVDVKGDLWRKEARGPNRVPLEWYSNWGEIDAEGQAELSNALEGWMADPRSQFAFSRAEVAEDETQDPPQPCTRSKTSSRAAVRGDLAFVTTESQCGFDCANGGIIALRKVGPWWFPIAHLDTWIT